MIDLEHIPAGDGVERNFNKLRDLVIDTGGQSVGLRFGADVVTWSGGSATSGDKLITHGLGKAPEAVFTQSSTIVAHARPTSIGATSFVVTMRTIDGSSPAAGDATFYWLVLG